MWYFYNAGLLGLYIGQVVFRASGFGRLGPNAYIDKYVFRQILFSPLAFFFYYVPTWFFEDLIWFDLQWWAVAIFLQAIPQMICCFFISFVAPALTVKFFKYPFTDGEDDKLLEARPDSTQETQRAVQLGELNKVEPVAKEVELE